MCNRTDCAGVWAGELACGRCEEMAMSNGYRCQVCGSDAVDEITLHYESGGWHPPYRTWLCREHQRELIGPVQEAVRKMREEREVGREPA